MPNNILRYSKEYKLVIKIINQFIIDGKFSKDRKISQNHPQIKEDVIQNFIFENPSVLGLGS